MTNAAVGPTPRQHTQAAEAADWRAVQRSDDSMASPNRPCLKPNQFRQRIGLCIEGNEAFAAQR